ncbi:hypothetical protein [Microbacterium marinilacus]|nr:hypothetical protein [Microbacterium marinilacus]MBY0689633.1 hypothetical protein [Microbacterium marinilacus]
MRRRSPLAPAVLLLLAPLSACGAPAEPQTAAARTAYAEWVAAQDDFLTGGDAEAAHARLRARSDDDMYAMLRWKLSGFAADGIMQRGRHEVAVFRIVDATQVEVPAEYGLSVSPATADIAARVCLDASGVEYLDREGEAVGTPTPRQELAVLFVSAGGGDLVVAYAAGDDSGICAT